MVPSRECLLIFLKRRITKQCCLSTGQVFLILSILTRFNLYDYVTSVKELLTGTNFNDMKDVMYVIKNRPIHFLTFCWPCISIYLFININQLDALNFILSFISSLYMFRAHVLIVRRAKIVLYSLWYHHTETSEWSKITKIIKIIKIQFYKYEHTVVQYNAHTYRIVF